MLLTAVPFGGLVSMGKKIRTVFGCPFWIFIWLIRSITGLLCGKDDFQGFCIVSDFPPEKLMRKEKGKKHSLAHPTSQMHNFLCDSYMPCIGFVINLMVIH